MDNWRTSQPLDPKTVARLLGGRAYGNRVSAPGPGHSRKDNSLSVLIDPSAPGGFVAHSFAGDDWQTVRDYVCERLDLPRWSPPTDDRNSLARLEQFTRLLKQESPPSDEAKPFDDWGFLREGYKQTAAYDYKQDGELLYQLLRYEHPSQLKEIRPRHLGPCGRWLWGCGTDRRVLYRADDIQKAGHQTVFVTEGEKDADRLASLGFLAVTVAFGSWSEEAVQALAGYECLILSDNDDKGQEKAAKAAFALYGTAASVRIVHLPNLPEKGDVSDWLDAGNDHNNLLAIALSTSLWHPEANHEADPQGEDAKTAEQDRPPPCLITAEPFMWMDPARLPKREWIYASHYIRRFISVTVAPGGVGKSSLGIVEALAMTSGRDLMGFRPNDTYRVWLWNGEDPMDELQRRVMAAVKHYQLGRDDFEGRLLDGEAEKLTRKAVELALAGDTTALRLCLDRIAPPRKDRPVPFALPSLTSAKDAVAASAALLEAVAGGDLTPLEAGELSKLVANYVEELKTADLEERLARVEARTNQ